MRDERAANLIWANQRNRCLHSDSLGTFCTRGVLDQALRELCLLPERSRVNRQTGAKGSDRARMWPTNYRPPEGLPVRRVVRRQFYPSGPPSFQYCRGMMTLRDVPDHDTQPVVWRTSGNDVGMRAVRVRKARQAAHATLILLAVVGVAGCASQSGTRADSRGHSVSTPPTSTSLAPTPSSTSTATGQGLLNSVSCAENGTCVAVGDAPTLSRMGPGSQWSTGAKGQLAGSESVSCVASGVCLMIGGLAPQNGFSATGFQEGDGQSWHPFPSLPVGPVDGFATTAPNQISCSSISFCVAVGGYGMDLTSSTGGQEAVVETWTGQAWASPLTPVVRPATRFFNQLWAVSCVTPTFCMAVGQNSVGTKAPALAEGWDGSQWKEITTPPVNGAASLHSVSCTSSSFCLALGTVENDALRIPTRLIVERWNGTSWTVAPAPHPFGRDLGLSTSALACTSPTRCLAVWSSLWAADRQDGPTPPNAGFPPVSQVWNGSNWTDAAMPNPSLASGRFNIFTSASCVEANDCVAVGTTVDEGQPTMLLASWNGSAWTEDPPPSS